jgi:ABC-2 type transport system ATP-binding protein
MHQHVAAISISQLTKRYGAVTALDRIDLEVPNGVTYGFLGPNGAGKTTAIRVLMGFIRPSAGRARIHGCDCWREGVRARANLGFLVPADALYPEMTGAALLDYLGELSGRSPILRVPLLEALELSRSDLGRRLGDYSKGMKQKLALTAAMQSAPALIILDEPTDGLDPLIQRAFEQVLADVRRQGCTIFMSSHDLTEVERTCERVAIIREGRIVAEESIAELRAKHHRTAEVTFVGEPPAGLDEIQGVVAIRRDGDCVVLSLEGTVNPLLCFLAARDDVADLILARPSLEDIFLGYYDSASHRAQRDTRLTPAPHEPLVEASR